jgi:hypothetical protein
MFSQLTLPIPTGHVNRESDCARPLFVPLLVTHMGEWRTQIPTLSPPSVAACGNNGNLFTDVDFHSGLPQSNDTVTIRSGPWTGGVCTAASRWCESRNCPALC